jgi:plastocyanin
MKRVLIAAALGGLLIVGAPTLASSAQRNDTKAEKEAADKGGDKADNKGGDNKGGDRGDHKGDRGDRSDRRGDRGDRGRYGHGYYRDGYYGGGYYGGEPYDCYYGPSGAYNCEPYGGDYYGGYDGGRYGSRGYGRNRNVTVSQMRFNPPEVYAAPGQEVLWVFRDGNVPHTVTADNNSFDSGQVTDGEFRLAFDQPGSYSYHCAVHPEMKGRVVVG